jgi:CheY-like chemotaxis protein
LYFEKAEPEQRMESLILVVESSNGSDPQIRDWVFRNPVVPTFAGNGVEALLWLGKGNIPDVIFADVDMGFISGIQFVHYLKSSGFFCDIPIVVIGNPEKHEAIASMIQAGAHSYLVRPFGPGEISDNLEKALTVNEAY